MHTTKKPIDWGAVETDYLAGDMSIREMAKWHDVSEAAIRKQAKAKGWVRPEHAPKAPVKMSDLSVTYTVERSAVSAETTSPEAIVERGRHLALRMLDELNAATSRVGELEFLIDEATAGDESDRRRETLVKAVSLPVRAATLKALALAVKTMGEAATEAAPSGKKEQRARRAREAGVGRFATPAPPKLVVDNG